MGAKIYVGGLPYSTTEQQLSDLFAAHGAVASARIITDKFTGQSPGLDLSKCHPMLKRKRRLPP
jgi:RNA recognition motif-containing protein